MLAAKKRFYLHPMKILKWIILTALFLITLYPFWWIIMMSFSSGDLVTGYQLMLVPKGFTLDNLKYILSTADFFHIYANTAFVVIVGTGISLILTLLLSYGLSQQIPGRKAIRMMVLFTMLFHGGMIPTYIVVRNTGLLNSLWALIIPVAISPFNTFLLINALKTIPPSLSESAQLDGAGELTILFRVILPLAVPTLATLLLFYAVGYWNTYLSALIYLPRRENWVLQVLLRQILVQSSGEGVGSADDIASQMGTTLKMATVLTAVVPIMVIYPFLQKYFIKGVMVGAIKE